MRSCPKALLLLSLVVIFFFTLPKQTFALLPGGDSDPTPTSISQSTNNSSDSSDSSSNCVVTQVGNPTGSKPPTCLGNDNNPATGGSGGSLITAAEDLVHAYQNCTNGTGSTAVSNTALPGCLSDQLKTKYPQSSIDLFAKDNATFDGYSYDSTGTQCIECIGFVRQSLILAYGTAADGNLSDHSANYLVDQGIKQFTVGSTTYTDIGTSHPQAGDIAIVDSNSIGHILIVKSVDPSNYAFTAIESNYNPFCTATDNNRHTQPDAAYNGTPYHFFRKQ